MRQRTGKTRIEVVKKIRERSDVMPALAREAADRMGAVLLRESLDNGRQQTILNADELRHCNHGSAGWPCRRFLPLGSGWS